MKAIVRGIGMTVCGLHARVQKPQPYRKLHLSLLKMNKKIFFCEMLFRQHSVVRMGFEIS